MISGLILIIFFLMVSSTTVKEYLDDVVVRAEKEYYQCFKDYWRFDLNLSNEDGLMTYEEFETRFEFIHSQFVFIVTNIAGEGEDIVSKTKQLYYTAVKAYSLGPETNKRTTEDYLQTIDLTYHNFCHGLYVASMTGIYLEEQMINFDNSLDSLSNKDEVRKDMLNRHAILMFTGLFHDAGHPGFGNNTFNNRYYPFRDNYIQRISNRMVTYFIGDQTRSKFNHDNSGFNNSLIPSNQLIDELLVKINNSNILEDVHKYLAWIFYHNIFGNTDIIDANGFFDDLTNPSKYLIYKGIDYTNMGYIQAIEVPDAYVIHAFDLTLQLSANKNLLIVGSSAVLSEFYEEYRNKYSFLAKITYKFDSNISRIFTGSNVADEVDKLIKGVQAMTCKETAVHYYQSQVEFMNLILKTLTKVKTNNNHHHSFVLIDRIIKNYQKNTLFYNDLNKIIDKNITKNIDFNNLSVNIRFSYKYHLGEPFIITFLNSKGEHENDYCANFDGVKTFYKAVKAPHLLLI